MKKIFILFLALLTTVLTVPTASASSSIYNPDAVYSVQAESVYIVNLDTNFIIYDKNSNLQVPAKGLTKLMSTALILSKYEDSLDTTMIKMPSAISDYVYGTTSADIRAGETVTLRQMLYGMLLANGNDAAQGTAYVLSENDMTGWISEMNNLSKKIGTSNSVWTDACGIDNGNLTSAVDIYLILRYLLQYDAFVDIMGTYQYQMPINTKHSNPYWLTNQNKMISKSQGGKFYRESIKGAKTDVSGYSGTNTGLQSCISWGVENGETYIYAVMNSPDSADTNGYSTRRSAQFETTQLVDWVSDSFAIQPVLDPDKPICEVPVKYSTQTDNLKLFPDDSLMTILHSSADETITQKVYTLPDYVPAPISQGDVVGYVTIMLSGEEIGTVNLIAGQDIARNDLLHTYLKLTEFFDSFYFMTVFILSVISLAIYSVWSIRQGIIRSRSKKVQRH